MKGVIYFRSDGRAGGKQELEDQELVRPWLDIDARVANLRAVFAEVARVLEPSGSLWLNVSEF